jgi:hypothetical protein
VTVRPVTAPAVATRVAAAPVESVTVKVVTFPLVDLVTLAILESPREKEYEKDDKQDATETQTRSPVGMPTVVTETATEK